MFLGLLIALDFCCDVDKLIGDQFWMQNNNLVTPLKMCSYMLQLFGYMYFSCENNINFPIYQQNIKSDHLLCFLVF